MVRKKSSLHNDLVRSSIRLHVPLEKQREVLDIIESVHEQVRFEPNCLYARIYRDYNEIQAIVIEELWSNREDMEAYLRSKEFQRILFTMEMSDMPPDIYFDQIIPLGKIDIIEKALNH